MKARKFDNPSRILKVFCYTPINKPLNGPVSGGKASHLLRLHPISYSYQGKKKEKIKQSDTYFIKGLRGALRHQIMQVCREYDLEVCHTSDKKADKHKNSLLPEGFHLLGSCELNGDCIIHQIFGSKGNEGLISVYADPITSISLKTANPLEKVQNVHIATENRNVRAFNGKSLQNFAERYFSGNFTFEIEVSKCNKVQLGAIIDAVMKLHKLGRGFNSGYGRIHIKRFQLLKRYTKIFPEWKEDSFIVKEEIEEKFIKQDVLKALQAWFDYVEERVSPK
ncbi:MAG: RAMP superfamily CRISPR-associated protein [Promethearchaeota archaeon]